MSYHRNNARRRRARRDFVRQLRLDLARPQIRAFIAAARFAEVGGDGVSLVAECVIDPATMPAESWAQIPVEQKLRATVVEQRPRRESAFLEDDAYVTVELPAWGDRIARFVPIYASGPRLRVVGEKYLDANGNELDRVIWSKKTP